MGRNLFYTHFCNCTLVYHFSKPNKFLSISPIPSLQSSSTDTTIFPFARHRCQSSLSNLFWSVEISTTL
jgi:hypothetical protein